MQLYYTKLKTLFNDADELYNRLSIKDDANEFTWDISYHYNFIRLPNSYVLNNSTLSKINEQWELVPLIIKMPPNTSYNWHVDAERSFAINLLLNNHSQSHTTFLTDSTLQSSINNITELVYEPQTLYLFNVQEQHAVLNLNHNRYLLSFTFKNHRSVVPYSKVLEYCKFNNLIEQ